MLAIPFYLLLNPLYTCFFISRRQFNLHKIPFIAFFAISFALIFTFRVYGITYGADGFNYDDDSKTIMDLLYHEALTGEPSEYFGFVLHAFVPTSRLFGPFLFPFIIYLISFLLILFPSCLLKNSVSAPPLLVLSIFTPLLGSFFNLYSTVRQFCIVSIILCIISSRYILSADDFENNRAVCRVNSFCAFLVLLSFGIHSILSPVVLSVFLLSFPLHGFRKCASPITCFVTSSWRIIHSCSIKRLRLTSPIILALSLTTVACISLISAVSFFYAKYHSAISHYRPFVGDSSGIPLSLIIAIFLLYLFFLKHDQSSVALCVIDYIMCSLLVIQLLYVLFPSMAPLLSVVSRFFIYLPWISIPIFAYANLSSSSSIIAPPSRLPFNLSINIISFIGLTMFLANFFLKPFAIHQNSHLNNYVYGQILSPLSPSILVFLKSFA